MKHTRGFTIIELMVVVAIIALLTAILMPSLDAARRMAKQVICSHSLKGIGLGWRMYLDEYPRQIPQASGLPMVEDDIRVMDVMGGYVASPDIWECPADDQEYFETYSTSYEYYLGLITMIVPDDKILSQMIEIANTYPDLIPVFGDAAEFHPTSDDPVGRIWCYYDGHVDRWPEDESSIPAELKK